MLKSPSSIFFCALLLINSIALYQSLVLQKRLSSIILAKTFSHYNYQQIDSSIMDSFLQSDSSTGYIYPAYSDFVWPIDIKDCSYYETLQQGFQISLSEVQNISTVLHPIVQSSVNDRDSKITFTYLEYDDSLVLTPNQKQSLLNKLNSGINNLTDIISNDKCNYMTKWQDFNGTYMCGYTTGTVDGRGKTNDKCIRFKMYYQNTTANGRVYCIQNLYTGDFCTAEASGDNPFTCTRHWCYDWEKFSTTSNRAKGTFTFSGYNGKYLTFSSDLAARVNSTQINQYSTLRAELI